MPGGVSNVRVSDVTNTSVSVTWDAASAPGAATPGRTLPLRRYTVQVAPVAPAGGGAAASATREVRSRDPPVVVSGLTPHTKYGVTVRAPRALQVRFTLCIPIRRRTESRNVSKQAGEGSQDVLHCCTGRQSPNLLVEALLMNSCQLLQSRPPALQAWNSLHGRNVLFVAVVITSCFTCGANILGSSLGARLSVIPTARLNADGCSCLFQVWGENVLGASPRSAPVSITTPVGGEKALQRSRSPVWPGSHCASDQ